MKNDTMYRQGDVLLVSVETLPEGLTEQQSPVLVEGEVTGHAHKVEQLANARILVGVGMLMYLQVIQPTRIVHEEHRPITLDPGFYEVVRQREYTPEAIRMVVD